MKFSVLMSVYFKEQADYLRQALESLMCQSTPPSEIVLVKDGALTEPLDQVIDVFSQHNPGILIVIALPVNSGLGHALAAGLAACSFDLVARMDSDDISDYFRFEKLLSFLKNNPQIDIVGSTLQEFSEHVGDSNIIKTCAAEHEDMIKGIKLRSPMNHATILFRKSRLVEAGGYQGNTIFFEDYALFIRLWQKGLRFHNLPDILYHMRVDSGLNSIRRRCGVHYIKKEINFLKHVHEIGAFTRMDQIKYGILKFPIRLLPPRLVLFVYNTFLRKQL
jgi:glycosyltransferase involved in cell wall biosynthesis